MLRLSIKFSKIMYNIPACNVDIKLFYSGVEHKAFGRTCKLGNRFV